MQVPINWLSSYCAPEGLIDDPRALAVRLTMTGTEVERIGHAGAPAPDGFVIGKVLTADKHPDADRLKVLAVDVGEEEPRTIVCGAPNVAAGQTVAVALPGAVMPGGQKLGKAKLRGVESSGMILSEREMEIGTDHDGIAVIYPGTSSASRPGVPGSSHAAPPEPRNLPLQEFAPISDPVLELEITPNRPDCLGIYGVARELHAISDSPLAPAPWESDPEATGEGEASDYASVSVEVPELCPRFTARVFTDVEIGPSPLWLKQRLAAAGQRPINNVVDITNYVMLLTGQPLHAFDLDKVPGGELIVRRAGDGEKMKTLDDVERTFDSEAVLVCDREQPSGIAGIMGGQVSEVSETTTRVLLEVATWVGTNILETSGKLSLRSEASTRFEKQLHPALTMRAQRVASRLLIDLCGAKLVPGTIDVDAGGPEYEPFSLALRASRTDGLLGMEIGRDLAATYLERLGFGATPEGDDVLSVAVPPDRHFDIRREIDLIEEVGRVHGIDEHLPATLPPRPPGAGGLARHQALLRRAEDTLAGAGLDEAITWSFVGPGAADALGLEGVRGVVVHNPLSEDQSVMRTELIGGLLDAASYNLARGAARAGLFESGRAYLPEHPPSEGGVLDGNFAGNRPAPALEPHRIAALVCGSLADPGWQGEERPADFYLAKGLVEHLCASLRAEVAFEPGTRPFLHPGRCADVTIGGRPAGWVGELHPTVTAARDLPASVAFEISAGALIGASGRGRETYRDLTSYPAVLEDLAVVADAGLPAAELVDAALGAGGALLASARIFDVYEGEQVGEGKRSLALRLEFRAPDRTLSDADVSGPREAIIAALAAIGGELRG